MKIKMFKMTTHSLKNLNKYFYEHRVVMLQCIPALVIFLLATYRLSEIGQPILFNDEIGYWSNSAFFMGDDWTSVTGRIGYYSYGYSLLLVPIRMLGSLFGWSWDILYRAAVVMNAGFLVMSYVLALKLSKRYLTGMNDLVRTVACFTVFTYSSYIVYAHITWTECTLMFFFWVFLYVMMRVVDAPCIGNHIALAIISFYIYTVHQRALGIVVTAIVMVVYLRICRSNRVSNVAAFLGSLYLYSLVHAMIKGNLQHVNYLGGESEGWGSVAGYALTKSSLVFLIAGIILIALLWLLEKGRRKTVLGLVTAGIALVIVYLVLRNNGYPMGIDGAIAEGNTDAVGNRLSVNDFSGQWGVIKNIFSRNGLIRLGISVVGKWFYLAAASGFVICWGIWGLFKNAVILLTEHVRQWVAVCRKRKLCETGAYGDQNVCPVGEDIWKDRVWLLGVLLAWFSTFMISAVYKEGLFKNDDLFNGRYIEFTLGFVLLYSLNCFINDRKWVFSFLICMVLYIVAGHLCQYAIDEVQRTEFELAHCVMFGRVFWNYVVPHGKVEELWGYICPLSIGFCVLLKLFRERFPRIAAIRTVLALMIPIIAWSHLGRTIVDAYVVVRNEKQAEPFVQFADWIMVLGNGEAVYYIADSGNDRNPGALQYMLPYRPVTVTNIQEVSFAEDAFYIMKDYLWESEERSPAKECEVVMRIRGYVLAINRNQNLAERWKPFK